MNSICYSLLLPNAFDRSKRTLNGSVFLSTLFIRCLSWMSSQGQGRWSFSRSTIHRWKLLIIKFVCNDLYISRIHCSPVHWPCYLFSRDRVSDDLTFRAVLLVGSSDWTFSFWSSLRRTLTSFCALHGGFPNPGALEQSWALKWSPGLIWYFNCSSRHISYDVSSWPSLLKCTFFFLASNL